MEKFGRSQPVKRVEDMRFLTGQGRYVDDIAPVDALHMLVLRAPVAHGTIQTLDLSEAREMPGVVAVWSADDLVQAGVKLDMAGSAVKLPGGGKGKRPERPILARDRVRHVGEAVAVVIADTLAEARDALEVIELDIADLPAKVDVAPGGEALHDAAPDNVAYDWHLGDAEAVEAKLDAAHRVVEVRVEDNRIICNAMEPRGYFAEMEGERLHVAQNGQGVWGPKSGLARHLRMDEDMIRVTNPDTGGGFGMKGMNYPEMYLVAHAARTLGRPVRWMSERTEAMLTDNAGRDLTTTARIGFDAENRIVAYHLDTLSNMGAHNSQYAQHIQTELFSKVFIGTYDVADAYMRCVGIYTNTTPVDAYRGAGRPEAIFVLERVMDEAARQLGVSPWELRRRNFIRPDQFPYTSVAGVTYDVGDFGAVLDTGERAADVAGFADRRKASERAGRLRGQGLCFYIESILGDPAENARVAFTDGRAQLYVGTQSNGQGHETAFAQFLHDQSGIPMDRIEVVQGDSDRIPEGGGTGGSRSGTVQNAATLKAAGVMVEAFGAFLAEREGVAVEDVSFDDERFRIGGSNLSPTMLEVAELAREEGRDDLLSHEVTHELEGRSFPNGAHIAEVEIDPETGDVRLERYTVVDDFGNLINPMIVEGQIHGGVAQGLGQALSERVVYDEDGQLLTASFMDYGMPRSSDLPMIGFSTQPTPSTLNPMGMKGCGEAGTVGALAAVANAVTDAVRPAGVDDIQMPFTPHRVWQALQAARADAAA